MYLPSPPAHGHPEDSEERPPFVLIEPYAYFADDRDNATTAFCPMNGFKGQFKVTFCTARPPLVSYMCFQATAYDRTPFAVEPQILATETDGSRVLLRVVFGDHPSAITFPHNRHYLVYDASGPSLQHLPHPGDGVRFSGDSLAFVRKCTHGTIHDYCTGNCAYVLAAHSGGFGDARPYQLYLYHSDTKIWQHKEMVLKPSPYPVLYHSTRKAITVGGDKGTVAWVDLWHNIIICDVLVDCPELRSLQLPPPILLANELPRGNPRSVRDIALLDGLFKYVQIQPGSCALGHWEWEVTVWSAKTSSSSAEDWVAEYKLKSCEIPQPSPPMLHVGLGEALPTLSTLQIGLPNLNLQDAGIVYFLSKVNHWDNDHTAWVIALDMRSKTIQKVCEFNPSRTLGLAKGYNASVLSKFLKATFPEFERRAVKAIKQARKNLAEPLEPFITTLEDHIVAMAARVSHMKVLGVDLLDAAVKTFSAMYPSEPKPAKLSDLCEWLNASDVQLDEWRCSADRAGADQALRFVLSWYEVLDLDALETLRPDRLPQNIAS